jgi:hypothetical protein
MCYQDEDFADYHVTTDEFEAWNSGWKYRNDGVDIQENEDENGNGFHIGFTQKNEWVAFTVNIEESGFYDLTTRYSSTSSGYINFLINDYPISENIVFDVLLMKFSKLPVLYNTMFSEIG